MKKVLVTGANGLIGKELLRQINNSNEVFAVVRDIPNRRLENVKYIDCDLSGSLDIGRLPNGVDCVIHLAQSENFRDFPNSAQEVFNVNTVSTLSLLDYARKANVSTFIYASSGGIYGNSDKGFLEHAPIVANNDLGFYLGTKLCSEIIVENYRDIFNTILLRFFFVYGKEQKRTMLIPRLVDSVIGGKSITLQGDDGIVINPIHVSDAAMAVKKAMNVESSNKYNVAGKENLSLREISQIIGETVNKEPNWSVLKDQVPKNLIGDTSKMIAELHVPQIAFSDGIKELIP